MAEPQRLPWRLPVPADGVHRGGWYLLSGRSAGSGVPARLCLRVEDAGPPCPEEACVPLPPMRRDGRWQALVRLRMDTHGLVLAALAGADVSVQAVQWRQIGKVSAGLAMLRHLAMQAGVSEAFGWLLGVLARLHRGARVAGDWAYARYRQRLGGTLSAYAGWLLARALAPEHAPQARAARLAGLRTRPLVSILLPVYDPPLAWLRACLDSVLAQDYPDWELCIADDASTQPEVRALLAEYAARDPRIRVVWRPHNGHIVAASNSALALARGAWVALLDHDDLLAPQALLEMVAAAEAHPHWRMLYSDEDKIDADGQRFDPYFKPDFDPALLLGQNCIGHLVMYDRDLLHAVGGFQAGMDGSQDWDLALRCVERLSPEQIGHVPQVLYHWRAHPGSSAAHPQAKAYATAAACRAVQAHLARTGQAGEVISIAPGRLRVRRALPSPLPRVSLIVPTRDRLDLLGPCLDGVLQGTDYPALDVWVVDNGSCAPETLAYLAQLARDPRVHVLRDDGPFNYSALNNRAAAQARGQVLCLLNNDIQVLAPDWLREMVAEALVPDVGAVGALLLYPDGRIQHAGVMLGIGGVAAHPWCGWPADCEGQMGRLRLVHSLSAVTGACLVVRRDAFMAVGGLDEALAVAFNDVDFCLRLRAAGYRNVWTPHARLVHRESASRGPDTHPERYQRLLREAALMRARWGALLEDDPAYNPNLSLDGEAFALADRPRPRACGRYGAAAG